MTARNETEMKTTATNPIPSTEQILFLLRRIIHEITLEPEKTNVTSEKVGMTLVGIEIDPNPGDYSKLLGSNRDHLHAMKMVCKLISDRSPIKYELTLKRAPEGTPQNQMPEFQLQDNWRRDHIKALTHDMFSMIIGSPYWVEVTDGKQGKTAVEVVVSSAVSKATCDWITMRLMPLYKSIGLKNGRIIAFNVIQNDEALAQFIRSHAPAVS